MSIVKQLLILGLVLCLTACPFGKNNTKVTVPKEVIVTVEKYVPVPKELTQPCDIAMPQEKTVAEAVRIARERRTSLEKCNEDKAKIRALGN